MSSLSRKDLQTFYGRLDDGVETRFFRHSPHNNLGKMSRPSTPSFSHLLKGVQCVDGFPSRSLV